MIRILQVVSNMSRAGIETMLMNYYRKIDKNEIQFDFLCNKPDIGEYEDEIKNLGGRIYRTPGLNPFKYGKYLSYMKRLFAEHPEWKIVHAHNDAFVVYSLFAAKRNNIPVRIAHAHSASFPRTYKLPLALLCRELIPYCCTNKWACGKKVGVFYYGKDILNDSEFHIHNNAIEINKFLFEKETRERIRKKYGLEGCKVIGHVGRFNYPKNHSFLIDIFANIVKKDQSCRLVLLGDGLFFNSIKEKVRRKGLEDKVIFVGSVSNTYDYYQAFDIFVMPSRWEGLPVTAIEAQTADLPCIFSDVITDEVNILPTNQYLSLNASISTWSDNILTAINNHHARIDRCKEITDAGYNINVQAQQLVEIYKSLLIQSNAGL